MSDVGFALSLFDAPPARGEVIVRPIEYSLARRSVIRWHYSHRMPMGNLRCYGAWEGETEYVGAVIWGDGATPEIGSPYGLEQADMVELVRVAFRDHAVPVTRVIAETIRDLKMTEPRLRLAVSFADERQGHLGKIYQAGNWIYAGVAYTHVYVVNGTEYHPRTLHRRYGVGGQSVPWLRANVDPNAERVQVAPKHRYLYPLDKAIRRRVANLALPYPRGLSVDGDTSSFHDGEASSTLADRSLLDTP
jgi:hypothetical protein